MEIFISILVTLLIIFLIYLGYMLYFKEYVDVCRVFNVLEKTLDTRDLLLMKILGEIKNKRIKVKTIELISKRIKARKSGFNEKIRIDVELNQQLKETYKELNMLIKNPLVKEGFLKIVTLEKKLRLQREEYSAMVEMYNRNIIHHRKVCMMLIRMKPLDTYKSSARE